MNLSEMSTFVRLQADTDTDDAPDATLTVYARAAYEDIKSRVFPWPDKKITTTVTSVSGAASYVLTGLSPATLEYVVSVSDSDGVLIYVSPEQYHELVLTSSSGTPTCYTVSEDGVTLWPTPNSAIVYTVRGYRAFTDWPSGSDEPDLPRGFDEAICWYMLGKFYQAQEDLELAGNYMNDYEVAVNRQLSRALRGPGTSAGPMIFGGDPRLSSYGRSYEDWVKRSVEG